MTNYYWRCPWCNGYRRRKWTRRHEFKSWTRLIAFHIALIPFVLVTQDTLMFPSCCHLWSGHQWHFDVSFLLPSLFLSTTTLCFLPAAIFVLVTQNTLMFPSCCHLWSHNLRQFDLSFMLLSCHLFSCDLSHFDVSFMWPSLISSPQTLRCFLHVTIVYILTYDTFRFPSCSHFCYHLRIWFFLHFAIFFLWPQSFRCFLHVAIFFLVPQD